MELPKPDETLEIDVTVRPDHVEDDIFKICNQIFNGIKRDDLTFKELKGGYVNAIYKVSIKNFKGSLCFRNFGFKMIDDDTKKDDDQISNSDFDKELFNRLSEFKIMEKVSKAGLSKPVYAKYNNGICYGFADGVTVNGPLMLTTDFLNQMASKLARFHCIPPLDDQVLKYETHYEKMYAILDPLIDKLISNFEVKMKDINEFPFNGEFPLISTMVEETKKVVDLLNKIGMGNIVFCHNDTNQMNIIWDPQTRSVSFIDMEMSQPNYDVMELGSLFNSYTGHFLFSFDGKFFPTDEYRKSFLSTYLKEVNKCKKIEMEPDEFEKELTKYFVQTSLSSLFHMLRVASVCPAFDLNPDLFKNEQLEESRKTIKYFCSSFGLKVYKLYLQKKDEFVRMAEDYIKNEMN